ncbi:hypothetical protein K493DRAFT_345258 [Basidiobolus meristosporus CBS 931.73]|uniref:VLIG-type G domain-containing protein n=1 Tax=Basidiobolus meristosporus CBS 931.73 TaxID=1314790 RepID=A0A1Y1Z3Z2_9FUNG|nr:hypothetical protein K493DRAFT_345258 [Basidiobolus meristosporus CBS 931.73]|eukprot:ORY04980.1 hypothetical protein K493DRAFT_345258 [Basidiobolus meristosporus CBS 931.73]
MRGASGARNKRPKELQVSMEWFWREILLIVSYNLTPNEVPSDFPIKLQKYTMLQYLGGKNLLVCSILGPQSSAKSTLLNYLFGADFQVSAGRCTKGMYASLFSTEYKGADNLLVLDTEGLLSIEKEDKLFDKQMTLLALAMSHIVLINIKGEMGTDMKDILEVTLLGLQRLRVSFPQPKIYFILRDMVDLDKTKQQNSIKSIQKAITDVAKSLHFEFDQIDEDSFILLPPAFSHGQLKDNLMLGPLYTRSNIFSAKPAENAIFTNTDQWVAHVSAVWQSVQQYGDFLNFSTLKEYYDRNHLGRILQNIIKDTLDGEMVAEAKEFQAQTLNLASRVAESSIEYRHLAEAKKATNNHFQNVLFPRYHEKVKEAFFQRTKDLRLTEGLKQEYEQTLENVWNQMNDYLYQETENKMSRGLVQVAIGKAIRTVREWIDKNITEQPTSTGEQTLIRQFEATWDLVRQQLVKKLKEYQPDVSKIQQDLWRDFKMVFKANPRLMVTLNSLKPAELQDLKLLGSMNPHSTSFSDGWREELRNYVTSNSQIGYIMHLFNMANAIEQPWYKILCTVSGYLSAILGRDRNNFWNSSTVQQEIIKFDNLLVQLEEQFLTEKKYTFSPNFHSLCFGDFFNVLVNVLHEQHLEHFDERLMKSRYDDVKTSSYIASLFIAAVSKKITQSMAEEYIDKVKEAASLTAEELLAKCERCNGEQEIFEYVTDMPNFMKSVFDRHLNEQKSSVIRGYFNGEYALQPATFLPFDEFLKKYYPNWTVPLNDDAEVTTTSKRRWYIVRRRLCEMSSKDAAQSASMKLGAALVESYVAPSVATR